MLTTAGMDARRTVILESDPPMAQRPATAGGGPGLATVRSYQDAAVEIQTEADDRRLLVLTDLYYPGWHATLDGNPVAIFRADHAFRAVPVPAGNHVVRFEYRPASFRVGLLISFGTLTALLGVMAWGAASKPIAAADIDVTASVAGTVSSRVRG
jgi:hypothetical protein